MSKKSGRKSNGLTRRSFLKTGTAVGAAALAAPMVASGLTRRTYAADPKTIRVLHTAPTMDLPDWSAFEQETGLKTEVHLIKNDVGLFLNEIMVNDGGDRYDLISTLGGTEKVLAADGYILPLDTSMMPNWEGVDKDTSESPLLKIDGKIWGTPYAMNADSFGYFPKKLNLPYPPEEVSWATVFDNPDAMGKTSTGDAFFYLQEFAAYAAAAGFMTVADPANLTPEEAEKAADLLIERKKAGQFRNFWNRYDDQLNDIKNGEVLAIRCWEPAAIEAQKAGLDFVYASAKEFYQKWMHTCLIPAQVTDRGNIENVYKAMDWYMGGTFATLLTPLRGYVTPRPDLGKKVVEERGLPSDVAVTIDDAVAKIRHKFSKEQFWFDGRPKHLEETTAAMERVKAA